MDKSTADPILMSGGEMGALMRGIDWAFTPFGTPEQWSPVLRSAVSMMLNGRFATALCWGADLRLLYNDAYRPILGRKHPESLGQPVREVFPEIWDRVGPLLLTPLNGGPASFLNHMLLEIDREGYREETYFSASYSGIYEEGKVVGVLVICHEVTDHVQSERRLTTLRDLAARLNSVTELNEACRAALSILAANTADIPFGLLYLVEGEQTCLVTSAGFDDQSNVAQRDRALQEWLLRDPGQTTRSVLVEELERRFGPMPRGSWQGATDRALVTLMGRDAANNPVGFLVVGVNSRVRLNERYRGFVELAADEIFTVLERLRLRERERRRAEAVSRLSRAKDEFLAVLGHELRNPLAPITSALRSMQLREDQVLQTERAIIERQVKHLTRLVDDLLDVSRILHGKIKLVQKPLELAEVIDAAVETAVPLIEERHQHLSVSAARSGLVVEADYFRLSQVISNLLTNAAKYTPLGGHITLECSHEDHWIVLKVTDDGIGISAEQLPYIFDFFAQVRPSSEYRNQGLGLGLTIVKSLTALHEGSVEVRSEGPGCGSEFIVRLPASDSSPLHEPPPNTVAHPRPLAGKRIFIVDDNEDGAAALAGVLELRGCITATAPDAPSALQLVTQFRPDSMLIDIGLPAMNGYELAVRLRAMPQLASVQLVAITGYAQETDRRQALASGFDEHLVKPLNLMLLESLLQSAPSNA